MAIMLGSNALDNCKIGANQVDKIYLGSSETWSATNLPNWVPSDWKSHIPANMPTGTSYAVFAVRYNRYITVFKVVAETLQTINQICALNNYLIIENPLHNRYSAFAKIVYSTTGTYQSTSGNYDQFYQYLGTIESTENAGGYTGDNAVLLEVQGGIVWHSQSVIGLDDYT